MGDEVAEDSQRPLTGQQRAILRFVADHVERHRFSPSLRDIQRAVGISSTSVVSDRLKELQRNGYLSRDPGKPRTLVLLPAAHEVLR